MRWRLKVPENDEAIDVVLLKQSQNEFVFRVGDSEVCIHHPQIHAYAIETSQNSYDIETWNSSKWRLSNGAYSYEITPLSWDQTSSQSAQEIHAQMPGRILKILKKPGDRVLKDEALLIMEAMKMENEIRSTGDFIVKNVKVQAGQSVESGTLLMELQKS